MSIRFEPRLNLTKEQLRQALLRWEQDNRDGKMKSTVETTLLPVEQVASESADHLWRELGGES